VQITESGKDLYFLLSIHQISHCNEASPSICYLKTTKVFSDVPSDMVRECWGLEAQGCQLGQDGTRQRGVISTYGRRWLRDLIMAGGWLTLSYWVFEEDTETEAGTCLPGERAASKLSCCSWVWGGKQQGGDLGSWMVRRAVLCVCQCHRLGEERTQVGFSFFFAGLGFEPSVSHLQSWFSTG
jgi:hypothetical protein